MYLSNQQAPERRSLVMSAVRTGLRVAPAALGLSAILVAGQNAEQLLAEGQIDSQLIRTLAAAPNLLPALPQAGVAKPLVFGVAALILTATSRSGREKLS